MIKRIDLSGLWNFELDPDKKGIEGRLFDRQKNIARVTTANAEAVFDFSCEK
jgi:hypothetical protein